MEKALESAIASNASVRGVLCADTSGFTVAEKGDLVGASAGRYVSIAKSASSISPDSPNPTILIETENRNIVVKDYDSVVIVLSMNNGEQ